MASPEEMAQSMRNNIPKKTGKNQAEWNKIIKNSDLEKHGQIVKMLKSDYGVTHGFANLLSSDFLNGGAQPASDDDLIASQYEKKADIKPIYDKLMKEINQFGSGLRSGTQESLCQFAP